MNASPATFFVTAAAGTSDLLAAELAALGGEELREVRGGVYCTGTLETAYRACLWSRVGLRVLWPVAEFEAADEAALYRGVRGVDWSRHLAADGTLLVDFTSHESAITHARFGAQRVKDAIVDQFREATGRRPSVDAEAPDLRVNLRLDRQHAVASIDLAGDSLHRRGYRARQVAAPLKENLAAAILLRSGWPAIAAAGGAFVDPMCGSGTLPIEAALIAADVAPGLMRERFGFSRWLGHDAAAWQRLAIEAEQRRSRGKLAPGRIFGFDRDVGAIAAAREASRRAGVDRSIEFRRALLAELPDAPSAAGLLAVNPPYGERIGSESGLPELYELLGRRLREGYVGWQAAVFTGNPPLGRSLGIEARRAHRMMNGPIECRLLRLEVSPERFDRPRDPSRPPPFDAAAARARPGAQMFANRLAKNLRELSGWAKREGVACYRLYDADMPEYAFAIDLYRSGPEADARRWLLIQEYAAPASVERDRARARREEVLSVLGEVTGVAPEATYMRVRRPQKGKAQYEKLNEEGRFEVVEEGGLRFAVNFTDYLDTGLFLDHRLTRARIRELANGKRFLNLFAYTGTATVYAAAGGAASTRTVDLSNTYLDWTRRNLELNGFGGARHVLERADCLEWVQRPIMERYDLAFVDPPTFSNSKAMDREFDVQRDHADLLRRVLDRLAPGGLLVFSTNHRRFRLDADALGGVAIEDWTAVTLPRDFARHPRQRQVFALRPGR
ncbi:MAG: bifunctional 23S rRNA (guanine(2069)-N(7))-methyltransferase RlmK/23S rRNA (guanine(2445)-N(2))-methyltransferase RlmL [Steroidobacteraceae bacterium]|nr:bifunctional 23S rRNA (guanine(2069)-N(7))-methyltransferase RlmK/23S rRNA (guanine(2445)-N(2))-methyltransferase RlmL [Steroidobacteraceae bacterium]